MQLTRKSAGYSLADTDSKHVRLDKALLLFLLLVLAAITVEHQAGNVHFDFGVFYYAAHMLLDGARHSLYELDTQRAFQVRFHRPGGLFSTTPRSC